VLTGRSERIAGCDRGNPPGRCRTSTGWVADNQEETVKKLTANTSRRSPRSLARNAEKIDDVMLKVDGVMGRPTTTSCSA